jgi:hypothetical protein
MLMSTYTWLLMSARYGQSQELRDDMSLKQSYQDPRHKVVQGKKKTKLHAQSRSCKDHVHVTCVVHSPDHFSALHHVQCQA